MPSKYKIAETETFQRSIKKKRFGHLYPKIKDYVYPILRENPYFGPNIKRLKGEFKDFHRFRIGGYRLFYRIVETTVTVFVIDVKDRKDAYK